VPFYRCGEGSGRPDDGGWWCALKGAIDGVRFCHEEGGSDGGRGGKTTGVTSASGTRRGG
jgi:hypothetical protein